MIRPADSDAEPTRRYPRLLYVGEFPPSNHHGGAILLRRLLDQHPVDRLTVIASGPGMHASQASDLLDCRHTIVPTFNRGLPRIVAKVLELVFVSLRTVSERKSNGAEALITILQGRYYLAAALAAWLTATPHITIVHDNFLSGQIGPSGPLRIIKRLLTKVLQHAAHIYAVSSEMQRLVRNECGIESEVQLPATHKAPLGADRSLHLQQQAGLVILFAGLVGYTVRDCLGLLIELIKSGQLKQSGIPNIQLHLCAAVTDAQLQALGWDHEDIVCKGWVPQSGLANELARADILFLPYSFEKIAREAVETAFPSKTADYLAAGKPLLVFGPNYSSLVRYASQLGFAEIVTERSSAALAQGIRNIACSTSYCEQLATKALAVFSSNHDLAIQQSKLYQTLDRITGASPT